MYEKGNNLMSAGAKIYSPGFGKSLIFVKKNVDNTRPLCYDDFTCEKGLFFCGHFSAPGGYL